MGGTGLLLVSQGCGFGISLLIACSIQNDITYDGGASLGASEAIVYVCSLVVSCPRLGTPGPLETSLVPQVSLRSLLRKLASCPDPTPLRGGVWVPVKHGTRDEAIKLKNPPFTLC